MNFDMERKEKAEKIEAVIGTYLPKEEGYQKKVEEAMNRVFLQAVSGCGRCCWRKLIKCLGEKAGW